MVLLAAGMFILRDACMQQSGHAWSEGRAFVYGSAEAYWVAVLSSSAQQAMQQALCMDRMLCCPLAHAFVALSEELEQQTEKQDWCSCVWPQNHLMDHEDRLTLEGTIHGMTNSLVLSIAGCRLLLGIHCIPLLVLLSGHMASVGSDASNAPWGMLVGAPVQCTTKGQGPWLSVDLFTACTRHDLKPPTHA